MAKICPTCGGHQIGCPVCNAPPKRALLRSDIYRGKPTHRKMMRIYGAPIWEVQAVDLSSWNGSMNFAITKTKAQVVILRYGYGSQWKDPKLDEYYNQARAQGIPVGGYWYCRTGEDSITTANNFADEIRSHPPQLDIHYDFEGVNPLSPDQTLAWIIASETRLQGLTGKMQVPYSSKGWWDPNVARSSRWMGRRKWPANWTIRDAPTTPIDWIFSQGDWWQHEADGNRKAAEYGSTGGDADMDLDYWYGSVEQFNPQYHVNIAHLGTPPPPPPPGTVPENVVIATGELAIHNTPQAILTNVVGHALGNTVWHPYEIIMGGGIKWYRVTKDGLISANYTRIA